MCLSAVALLACLCQAQPGDQLPNILFEWKLISKTDKRLPQETLKGRGFVAFEFNQRQLSDLILNMPRLRSDAAHAKKGEWDKIRTLMLPGADGKPVAIKLARCHKDVGSPKGYFEAYAIAAKSFPIDPPQASLCSVCPLRTDGEKWGVSVTVPIAYDQGWVSKCLTVTLGGREGVGFSYEYVPNRGGE